MSDMTPPPSPHALAAHTGGKTLRYARFTGFSVIGLLLACCWPAAACAWPSNTATPAPSSSAPPPA